MIKAFIENKDSDTLIVDLPCSISKLYDALHSVGIMISLNKIKLTDSEATSIRVKLYSDNDIGNHFIQIFNDENSLEEVNAAAYLVTTADDSIKNELEQQILYNQYRTVKELAMDICQMTYDTGLISTPFYFPLEGSIYDSEYGSTYMVDGSLLAGYESDIREALKKYMSRNVNNIDEYYGEAGNEKLLSADWDLVNLDGKLFRKVDIRMPESMTEEETEEIREWIIGQNANGIGEGFEQQGIQTNAGTLNVSFWQDSNDYFVYTQSEMDKYVENRTGMQFGGM